MSRKVIKTLCDKLIAPALTSVFLFLFSLCKAPEATNYTASFISQGLVAAALYLMSKREKKTLKSDITVNDKQHSDFLDGELKKATDLLSLIKDDDKEGKEHAAKYYQSVMREKDKFIQRQFKKYQDESDRLSARYREVEKEQEDAESAVLKNIDDSSKFSQREKLNGNEV